MANEQRLEQLREGGAEAWNAWRDSVGDALSHEDLDLSGADLRGADLPGANLIDVDFTRADLRGADLIGADLIGADLTNADLRGAYLIGADLSSTNLTKADFSGVNLSRTTLMNTEFSEVIEPPDFVEIPDIVFSSAKFIGADLSRQDLTNAKLINTDLTDASLVEANLYQANLATARITGVDFTGVALKDAMLFREMPLPTSHERIKERIASVGELLDRIHIIKATGDGPEPVLYFRGEAKSNWDLTPSVYRDALIRHEGKMLRYLISRRPSEFSSAISALTQWMLAQHHGLKTRLLDVTKNPLVGLFFACGGYDQIRRGNGRLRVFAVQEPLVETLIKQYDSDAVSIVANFARMADEDKRVLMNDVLSTDEPLSFSEAKERLLQGIKAEKPYFADRIDVRDLYRVFIVEPQQLFERIRVQDGAFLISAFHRQFEVEVARREVPNLPIYDCYQLIVPQRKKNDLLADLRTLGITRETLFPGLDESAKAITKRYKPNA